MTLRYRFPKPLKRGDKVALVAPAGPVEEERLLATAGILRDRGFVVSLRDDASTKTRYLAGSDERRSEELFTAINDPEVKAVFLARGGYGSQRIISSLGIGTHLEPKIIAGFSDNTALLSAFSELAGWVVLHGPHLEPDRLHEVGELLGVMGVGDVPFIPSFSGLKTLRGGAIVEAPLCGGCLSLLSTSIGTPYQWNMSGKILFVEEVGEYPYRIDRMLSHLVNSGALEGVVAVAFGETATFIPAEADKRELEALLGEFAGSVDFPVVTGVSAGHVKDNRPLPMGAVARLDPETGTLTFLEAMVR